MTGDTEEGWSISILAFRFLVLINIYIVSVVLWNKKVEEHNKSKPRIDHD
jgi:hypothetical protein